MNDRLRLLSGNALLVLDGTDGRETLFRATDLFRYIDPNFKQWDCETSSPPAERIAVEVYEMVRDSTFSEMFGGFGVAFDSVALTQAQIKQFARLYPNWLKGGGNGTFFLFNGGIEYLVAAIYYFSDGRLGIRLRRLKPDRSFRAQKGHRLVSRAIGVAT